MKVVSSALLAAGGVLTLVGLPLRWSLVTATGTGASVSATGLSYAGYDVATTVALGVLLIAAAVTVWVRWRWAPVTAVVLAVLACMWATLVYSAAQYPADGGPTAGVTVTVGTGAYVLAAGGLVALVGSVLSFVGRRRGVAASASGAQPAT